MKAGRPDKNLVSIKIKLLLAIGYHLVITSKKMFGRLKSLDEIRLGSNKLMHGSL